MKTFAVTTVIASAVLLASGCATKKFVRETSAPIQAKVDQVGDQAQRQGQAIEETRTEVKAVDERATTGINGARERAMAADTRANEAMTSAKDAIGRADKANESSQKNTQEIGSLRQNLGQVVAGLDDYQLKGEVSVPFNFNQHQLAKEAQEELDKLMAGKNTFKRFFIAVEGYTDQSGPSEYNAALSRRRADAVVQYLVTKHDIPIYRIHMVGLGEQRPAEDANNRAARARNRRVEVKVFSADQGLAMTRLQ